MNRDFKFLASLMRLGEEAILRRPGLRDSVWKLLELGN
jgi:hypothetical protein